MPLISGFRSLERARSGTGTLSTRTTLAFPFPRKRLERSYTSATSQYSSSALGACASTRGWTNLRPLDCEHSNYVVTMPYPEVKDNNVIETANGLRVEFLELGKRVRVQYKSRDGLVSFDVLQTAVTPLLPRGHAMPGDDKHTDSQQKPGGSEQFMYCVGILQLNGKEYAIECYPVRDRSWRQTRTEDEVVYPPVGWSPMCFGQDLSFNQVGYEAPDTNPIWDKVFTVDKAKPSHYFAWVVEKGEVRNIVRVHRNVTKYHPELFAAIEQTIEAEDETGQVYKFKGRAVAMAQLPSWPNNIFTDSVYRWEDGQGRVTHCAYQEAWYSRYQRFRRGKLRVD